MSTERHFVLLVTQVQATPHHQAEHEDKHGGGYDTAPQVRVHAEDRCHEVGAHDILLRASALKALRLVWRRIHKLDRRRAR